MPAQGNPLIDDGLVDFLLYAVLDAESLCQLEAYQQHSKETFDLYIDSVRRFARQDLWPTYKPMDENPPVFRDGRIHTHPGLPALFEQMVDLGVLSATRSESVGGQQMPMLVHTLASAYLMAANLGAYGFIGLTHGAAHLIEAFGDDELKTQFMERMYAGEWTGTMALTEPHAGSSLADITTTATPTDHDYYLIKGSKIFISGADHGITDNVINLTLARIEGAPEGTKGISLFAVPKLREEGGRLVSNDVTVAGLIHKIGWKGLPSLALEFGDEGDCRGWLVGEPNQGLRYMFQMMNQARIMVGVNAAATASAAYHESRLYALDRKQGRKLGTRDSEPVPIIEHADVRRMLLRQKAIVEGSLALLATVAKYADVADHGTTEQERERAQLLLDLLTPVAKTFPAERGFEANALAIQIHGGYGYTSEYLPEAFMRDQKLNSLHEGTSGIQSMDLLGRKVMSKGGAPLRALAEELTSAIGRARESGCDRDLCDALERAVETVGATTMQLGQRGMSGDTDGMLGHSWDYLDMFATLVIGWQWLLMDAAAHTSSISETRRRGIEAAARYWIQTEIPRISILANLCLSNERSYIDAEADWF
ncbi:MAG: acyl-CoA dehydrogenase [Myxococcales bacterium SG8_38]|nr:MAG: acyl-CoA dehydrogenase [Myxococcales bacterium SG8_38]